MEIPFRVIHCGAYCVRMIGFGLCKFLDVIDGPVFLCAIDWFI